MTRHFAPPRAPQTDDDWLLPDPEPEDAAMTDAEWVRICSEPLLVPYPDTTLSHLYETALRERRES